MFFFILLLVALCAIGTFWRPRKEKATHVPMQRRPKALTKWWSIKKGDLTGSSHSSASSADSRTSVQGWDRFH